MVSQDKMVSRSKISGLRDCLVFAAKVSLICRHRDTFWKSQGNRKGVVDDLPYNQPAVLRNKSTGRADWLGRFVWPTTRETPRSTAPIIELFAILTRGDIVQLKETKRAK
jgi:hypothetical protein